MDWRIASTLHIIRVIREGLWCVVLNKPRKTVIIAPLCAANIVVVDKVKVGLDIEVLMQSAVVQAPFIMPLRSSRCRCL